MKMDFTWKWMEKFVDHVYYLLPLCIHSAMPLFNMSDEVRAVVMGPFPAALQALHVYSWVLLPFAVLVYGSFSLDSLNTFCFFPGAPYFHRVITTNLETERKKDVKVIRDWVMENSPPDTESSHYWFHALPDTAYKAFDRCANATEILGMFRSLFSERHYCVDVVDGMNEIYVTGPSRLNETANSDQIFDMRHVDGPWGVIPFVSLYRCLVGMDRNHVVSPSDAAAALLCCVAQLFSFQLE